MNNELTPAYIAPPDDCNDSNILSAQIRLWEFLGRRVERYTLGYSSSVRTEVAQELLQSICFTLNIDLNGSPQALKNLLDWDLDKRFATGIADIEQKIDTGRRLWQAACLSVPKIENVSLRDTLKSIGGFWKRYDYRFFAHDIPCDIDYQLYRPIPENLMGVDYVNEYLRRIIVENDLLRRFAPNSVIQLLDNYCQDYKGMLINLYEPIATNAIGLSLCGGDIDELNISNAQRGQIAAILEPLPKQEAVEALQTAASKACNILAICQPPARLYLRKLAANLYPRINAALSAGSMEGVFLSVR